MSARLVRFVAGTGARWVAALPLRARIAERGATAAEYALMVGLIATVIIGGVALFGMSVDNLFVIPAGVFGGP